METQTTMLGVKGRLTTIAWPANNLPRDRAGLFMHQTFQATRPFKNREFKPGSTITIKIRFDDNCRNGHNTFAITGEVQEPRERDISMGGCIHDELEKAFPEFAHLIKWHLMSTDGPMHYIANAVYFASNRDHWGLLKGEPHQYETFVQFGKNPLKHRLPQKFVKWLQTVRPININDPAYPLSVIEVPHKNREGQSYKFSPKYTYGGYDAAWHDCPFDTKERACDFLTALNTCDPEFVSVAVSWGEGKERELDKARAAAIWPEATDAELSVTKEELTKVLNARLPGLMAAFRIDVELCGFKWEA